METILELSNKANELGKDITDYLESRIIKFKKETGLTPNRINVDMIDISNMNSLIREFTVGKVNVEIIIKTP